jgi:hypothetical protein
MAAELPSASELVFADCGPAARWLADTLQMERDQDADAPEYSLGAAHGYLRSILPSSLEANTSTAQLVDWWITISRSFGTLGERDRPYTRV